MNDGQEIRALADVSPGKHAVAPSDRIVIDDQMADRLVARRLSSAPMFPRGNTP